MWEKQYECLDESKYHVRRINIYNREIKNSEQVDADGQAVNLSRHLWHPICKHFFVYDLEKAFCGARIGGFHLTNQASLQRTHSCFPQNPISLPSRSLRKWLQWWSYRWCLPTCEVPIPVRADPRLLKSAPSGISSLLCCILLKFRQIYTLLFCLLPKTFKPLVISSFALCLDF